MVTHSSHNRPFKSDAQKDDNIHNQKRQRIVYILQSQVCITKTTIKFTLYRVIQGRFTMPQMPCFCALMQFVQMADFIS